MPNRAKRPCRRPGCSALVEAGYCTEHQVQPAATADRARKQRLYDQARGSSAERGYDARWQRLRKMVLAEEPLCRECLSSGRIEAASDVDHIVAKRRGGTDDRENLQGLCGTCHKRKTLAEMREDAAEKSSGRTVLDADRWS